MRKLGLLVVVFSALLGLTGLPGLLQGVTRALSSLSDSGSLNGLTTAGLILPIILTLAIILGLLYYRHPLTQWLFPDEELEVSTSGEDLLRVLLVVVGVTLIAEAVPSVFSSVLTGIGQYALMSGDLLGESDTGSGVLMLFSGGSLAIPLLQALVGFVLVRKSGPWACRLLMARREDSVAAAEPVLPTCPSCGEPYDPGDYRPGALRSCIRCRGELPDT